MNSIIQFQNRCEFHMYSALAADYELRDVLHSNYNMHRAVHIKTGISVLLKVMENGGCNRVSNEINIMRKMDYPFIAKLFEVVETDHWTFCVMEYPEGLSLLELVNTTEGLTEDQGRHYFCQLISTLDYLHEEQKCILRNLKTDNILLDKYNNIRLINFDFSRMISEDGDDGNATSNRCPSYPCPELIKGEACTPATDVWSAGIILYGMIVGVLPFAAENVPKQLQKVLYEQPEMPKGLSPSLRDLLTKMLAKNPGDRMTVRDIMRHPWFVRYEFATMISSNYFRIRMFQMTPQQHEEVDTGVIQTMTKMGYTPPFAIVNVSKGNDVVAYRIIRSERIKEGLKRFGSFQLSIVSSPTKLSSSGETGRSHVSTGFAAVAQMIDVVTPPLQDNAPKRIRKVFSVTGTPPIRAVVKPRAARTIMIKRGYDGFS